MCCPGAPCGECERWDPGHFGGSGTGPEQVVSVITLSIPSRDTDALARELLLVALEDLSQEQLKRFRHKLRDAPLDGRSIPWGRLENSDPVDLVDKLTQFYGSEPAVDVTRKILKKADARDVAVRLKAQQLQRKLGGVGWACSPRDLLRPLHHRLRLCFCPPLSREPTNNFVHRGAVAEAPREMPCSIPHAQ